MEYKHFCEDGHIRIAWNEDIDCPICSEAQEKIDNFRAAIGSKDPTWVDCKTGEKIEKSEDISNNLANEVLERYFKAFKPAPPNSLTLLEMLFYGILFKALKHAQEKNYFKPEQQASYILGYLSSKIPFDKMNFSFNEK